MATENNEIVFNATINGTAKVSQSLADLKKELKAAQSAALNGDGVAAKRVAELRDKMDDLKDSVKTLQGSGVEKAQSSFRLLGDGLKNFDFDKIKTGFKGIGTAMAAIPIFLIAEGISYLIENWKELSEGTGVLAKVLQGVTWVFTKLKEEIYALTDALGITNSVLEKQGEAIKANADKAKEALEGQNAEYDRQIRVAKAAGKSTIELEQAKQQAIIDTNLAVARQIEAFVRAGGEFDEEKRKLLTASLEAIKNAKVTEFEIEQNHTKDLKAEYKKRKDDKKKELDDLFNAALADQEKDESLRTKKLEKEKADALKLEEDRAKTLLKMRDDEIALEKQTNAEKVALWDSEAKNQEKLEQEKQAAIDAGFQHAQLVTQNLQTISDIGFSAKLAKVKKGSKEEEDLMKKQFEVNKKLQVAQTVISTITGAREAYKSLATIPIIGPGLGIAAAAAATLAGLSAIQKINSTKFESASAPSTDSGSSGGMGGGGSFSNSAPTTNAPTTQPFTRLDESGRNQSMPTVKAYVVESEMTDSQKRVGRLTEQASF